MRLRLVDELQLIRDDTEVIIRVPMLSGGSIRAFFEPFVPFLARNVGERILIGLLFGKIAVTYELFKVG